MKRLSDTPDNAFEQLKGVRQTADTVRNVISIVTILLGSIFTFAKIKGLPVLKVSSDDWSRFFLQVALVVYFWSFIFGARSDLRAQEQATRRLLVPKKQIYKLLSWCAALVVVFTALWRIDSFAMFSLVLMVYFAIDWVLYHYFYSRVLQKQFADSRKAFSEKNNTYGKLEVDIVDEYMKGRWRRWRWGFGLAWISIFLIADATGAAATLAGFTRVFSADSLLALSILTLVLVMEIWMWGFRVIRLGQQRFADDLRHQYDLNIRNI